MQTLFIIFLIYLIASYIIGILLFINVKYFDKKFNYKLYLFDHLIDIFFLITFPFLIFPIHIVLEIKDFMYNKYNEL